MKTLLVALNASYMHTNLALRQILAALPDGAAQLYEGHINLPYRRVMERIAREKPDVIGFSCYIFNIAYVLRLCRALRVALPGVRLMLGGPEVSHCARELLAAQPCVDFVLSGEGEQSVPALLCALAERADLHTVPGLSFHAPNGEIVCNPEPPLLPPERWPDPYAGGIAGLEERILYIETSRGCPFHCAYCLSPAAGGVRALDVQTSVARLTALAEQGAHLIKLVDRTFNFDRARANAIWSALIEHSLRTGLRPTYHFEIGAHLLDEAALEVLKKAPEGLFQFEAGIQSTAEETLRAVGRNVPYAQLQAPLERVMALGGIHLHVDLIAGLPGEDMARFRQSFDDAFRLGAHRLQLGFLKLLHGSRLRAEAEQRGLRFEPDPPYEVIATREMDFEQLSFLKDVETLVDWYYNSERYAASMKLLTRDRSPFDLFAGLARAGRAEGLFDAERAEKARAQALLRHCECPGLADALRHDLLLAGRRRDLPDELAFQENDQDRAALRQRFHPVRGQSVCRFGCDVLELARTGRYMSRDMRILYDAPKCEVLETPGQTGKGTSGVPPLKPRQREWFPLDSPCSTADAVGNGGWI